MSAAQLRALWLVVTTALRADRRGTLALLALSLLEVAAVAEAWVLKLLTDAAVRQDGAAAVRLAVLLALLAAVVRLATHQAVQLRTSVSERIDLLLDRRLMELSAGIPGLEHHEHPEYRAKLELLRWERPQLTMALGAIVSALSAFARLLAAVALLARLAPQLTLLPLFAVPAFLAAQRAVRIDRAGKEAVLEHWYQATHLFELSTTAAAGKELRVLGLREELPARQRRIWARIEATRRQAGLRAAAVTAAGWTVFALAFTGAMAFTVRRAATGQATAGDVAALLALAVQLNTQVEGLVGTVGRLLLSSRAAEYYRWLVAYAAGPGACRRGGAPAPERLRAGIRLEGVSFRYPGTEADALDDVTLELPAGAAVALVGENGAGKTTLVKLLCGFYAPTRGRLLVDGVELAEHDLEDWRRRLAGGFQDFMRFELLLREAVGVGDLPRVEDRQAVLGALRRARSGEVLEAVRDGLETRLGRSFWDGVDLSGGQWQKLALARALMREAPLLLVLDEPTASLDAQTEHQLFDRYASAARQVAASTGGITLLVSHRFSTVGMADLVAVLERGRLVEFGDHHELMARQGLYAELYQLQARGYR